jgi:hypothetical protein
VTTALVETPFLTRAATFGSSGWIEAKAARRWFDVAISAATPTLGQDQAAAVELIIDTIRNGRIRRIRG